MTPEQAFRALILPGTTSLGKTSHDVGRELIHSAADIMNVEQLRKTAKYHIHKMDNIIFTHTICYRQ